MKVLMIVHGDYPPDIRIEKEAVFLGRRHKLFLLANNRGSRKALQEHVGPIHVFRMNHEKTALKNTAYFMNPFWLSKAFAIIRKHKIDSIHVHDLPLAFVGIAAKCIFSLSVTLDLHENYPEALRIWEKKGSFPMLLRNPFLADIYERISLMLFDHVIVVDENHKRFLIEKKHQPTKKISVLTNAVDLPSFTAMPIDRKIVQRYMKRFVISYVGNFGVERGLEVAIQAVEQIRRQVPNVLLLMVGEGSNRKDLEALVASLGIQNHVEFTGWIDFSLIPSFLSASSVCIIPQPRNALIDNGIPHKMFQYMAMRKPILAADSKAITRVIRETRCGEVFASGSSDSFCEAVEKIMTSRIEYGNNGLKAVRNKYNWDKASRILSEIYP